MADVLRLIGWSLLCIVCAVYTPPAKSATVTEYCAHLGSSAGCSGAMWQPTLPQAYEYWLAQEVASGGASVAGCTRQVRWRSGFDPESASGNIAEWSTCAGAWWQAAYNVARTVRTREVEEPPPPSQCPKPETEMAANIPSIWEGLTEAAAKSMIRSAARGTYAECFNGCTIKRDLGVCGGIGSSWRCEMTAGVALPDVSCGGAGACDLAGNACAPYAPTGSGGTPTVTVKPSPVPGGYCPGEVNGVTVYVKCDRVVGLNDGSSTTTTNSGTMTVTSQGETVCSGNSCTTTIAKTSTTSVTGGSSTTSTGSSTQVTDKSVFCRDNPTHPACKEAEQSRFGGSCNSAFTCSGDAAMCATAKAVNETNCALSKTSPESALYESEKAKTGNQTTALPGNETISLGSGSFSQTNLLGSAQCIPDLTVTVMSKSITLPFSDVCPWLEHLGNLLVSVSLLASIRIVSRG